MVAIEVFTEDERSIRAGLLGERAQELDHAVARYLPMLRKRALRFLGNAHDAEDAVQDAFLALTST